MKFIELLNLSIRNYKIKPLRTFLTVLGVGVGIGTVLFLVALGYGVQNLILSRISTSDALLSMEVSPGPADIVQLSEETIKPIIDTPEVVDYSPVVSVPSQISTAELSADGLVIGVKPSYFSMSGQMISEGNFFTNEKEGVVITSAGAQLLNGGEDKEIIGTNISLTLFVPYIGESGFEEVKTVKVDKQFPIIGIVDDIDRNYLFVPLEEIALVTDLDYSQLYVKVDNNKNMPSVRESIIQQGFMVSSLSDIIDQANKIFRIIQIVLAMFGLIALIVSAIGMFNTMTISLLERINEIGIMRSIGASAYDIRMLFLLESTFMGFAGGVGGVVIGYIGGRIANIGINMLASYLGGQAVNIFFYPIWFVLFIILFSTIIGFITGIYPSKRAAKLNPLDALRYK